MSGARKNKISWAERVSASLREEPYSAKRTAAIVTNSPYESEIRKGLGSLREAELLDRETQAAVILAGRDAPRVADALELLHENRILTNKNVAAVSELSHYADLLVEKLLSYHAKSKLTDEQRVAAIQEIKTSRDHAWQKLGKLKEALDFKKINTMIDFAKACVELKPFSQDFLKTLNDNDRFAFVCEMLIEATEQEELKKLFKEIVKLDPALLTQMDSMGNFPLVSAIGNGDVESAELLIECGANPNQTLGDMTAMAYAKQNKPELFQELQKISKLKNSNEEPPEFWDFYFFTLGKILGYPDREKGVCYGYCLMAMQAFLLAGDEPGQHPGLDEFYHRISKICEISPEKHLENLYQARRKIQESGSVELAELTEPETIALSLPAFYENVEIVHRPTEYPELYEKGSQPVYQSVSELSLKLTASKQLEEQGGVTSVWKFSGVYKNEELQRYFEELKKNATTPVALLVCSRENDHAILVTFDPVNNQFILINPGNAKDFKQPYYFKEVKDLAKKMVDVLAISDRPLLIGTTVFSAAANDVEAERSCGHWMKGIQDIQKVTPEKTRLKLPGGVGWVNVADEQGEVGLVKKLLDTQNSLHGYKGRALFMKQRNDAKFVEETKKLIRFEKGGRAFKNPDQTIQ